MDESATPQELIAGTDWDQLKVFFGPGEEPGGVRPVDELLTVLVQGVPAQQACAVHELGEVINHQCSVAEATAPLPARRFGRGGCQQAGRAAYRCACCPRPRRPDTTPSAGGTRC